MDERFRLVTDLVNDPGVLVEVDLKAPTPMLSNPVELGGIGGGTRVRQGEPVIPNFSAKKPQCAKYRKWKLRLDKDKLTLGRAVGLESVLVFLFGV